MRALVAIVFVVAGGCDPEDATSAPPAHPPAKVETAAAQRALHDCRDGCEESAIVAQASDATLQACRARCDERFGAAAAPPHEVPSRITRAAPVHAPPLVRPR